MMQYREGEGVSMDDRCLVSEGSIGRGRGSPWMTGVW